VIPVVAVVNSNLESEAVLNIVLMKLKGIFPAWRNAIKSQTELDNIKREWLTAFIDNNIRTDDQIKKGLSLCRKSTSSFIPSLGQFIEWCKIPSGFEHIELTNLGNVKKLTPEQVSKKLKDDCPWYKPNKVAEPEPEKSEKQIQYEATGSYHYQKPE